MSSNLTPDQRSRSVFVKWRNSPSDPPLTWEKLKQYFSQFGYVENAYVNNANPINGTVRFRDIFDVGNVFQNVSHKIEGRFVEVEEVENKIIKHLYIDAGVAPVVMGTKGKFLETLKQRYKVKIQTDGSNLGVTIFKIRGVVGESDVEGCVNAIKKIEEDFGRASGGQRLYRIEFTVPSTMQLFFSPINRPVYIEPIEIRFKTKIEYVDIQTGEESTERSDPEVVFTGYNKSMVERSKVEVDRLYVSMLPVIIEQQRQFLKLYRPPEVVHKTETSSSDNEGQASSVSENRKPRITWLVDNLPKPKVFKYGNVNFIESYIEQKKPLQSPLSVEISRLVSLDEFYVSTFTTRNKLRSIEETLEDIMVNHTINIPKENLKENHACVVQNDEKLWCRGKIIQITNEGDIFIELVDYGMICSTKDYSLIKLLPSGFVTSNPPCVYRCKMAESENLMKIYKVEKLYEILKSLKQFTIKWHNNEIPFEVSLDSPHNEWQRIQRRLFQIENKK